MTEFDRKRLENLKQAHRTSTGKPAERFFQAPGRVNLLGEHTDYSGGFCMPAALNFNTLVTASHRQDDRIVLHSVDFHDSRELSLEELQSPAKLPMGEHWSSYCFGVAWSLLEQGVALRGVELSFAGNVPLGAGLSSSASVEVATATALLAISDATLPAPPASGVQVALLCQQAENRYVGAPCGIMDQFISANGVAGNALALDTRALTAELAPIPTHLRLVVCNSMVKHSVATGDYGVRRREVEEAASVLHAANPQIHQLRDATVDDLNRSRAAMSDEAFRRARHVITDSNRVVEGLAALRAGDTAGFGRLMTQAHASFRDDFAASCKECDLLVELALQLPGCLGSRLTGGGFGGCTVSLVEAAEAQPFANALREQYRQRSGVTADLYQCETADGAGEIHA